MLRSIQTELAERFHARCWFQTQTKKHGAFIILSLKLLIHVRLSSAHPQCLDFEPPFKPPWHLEFCTQYEQFGCCDQKTDNSIAERYWDIIDQLDLANYDLCEDMLKELMCQVNMSFSGCVVV